MAVESLRYLMYLHFSPNDSQSDCAVPGIKEGGLSICEHGEVMEQLNLI